MTGLTDRFVYTDTLDTVRSAISYGDIPLWSPWPMLRAHPDISRSWAVTSDSLAVWLASALHAWQIVLIKHRQAMDRAPSAMVRDGVVDTAFPSFVDRFDGAVVVAGSEDLVDAAALFSGPSAAVA